MFLTRGAGCVGKQLWFPTSSPRPPPSLLMMCYRWASVFPLSTAATAAVSFAHFKGETFWWVLATGMVVIATIATVLVAALTIRAVVAGTLPASPESLSLYWKVRTAGLGERGFGVTTTWGEIGGASVPLCQPPFPATWTSHGAVAPLQVTPGSRRSTNCRWLPRPPCPRLPLLDCRRRRFCFPLSFIGTPSRPTPTTLRPQRRLAPQLRRLYETAGTPPGGRGAAPPRTPRLQ